MIASSGTWGLFFCGFLVTLGVCQCPDGLEQIEEDWQELVIVLGHLPVICEGFLGLFPTERQNPL